MAVRLRSKVAIGVVLTRAQMKNNHASRYFLRHNATCLLNKLSGLIFSSKRTTVICVVCTAVIHRSYRFRGTGTNETDYFRDHPRTIFKGRVAQSWIGTSQNLVAGTVTRGRSKIVAIDDVPIDILSCDGLRTEALWARLSGSSGTKL